MPTQLHAKPRVAFDTNMLLAIRQLKVDVFSGVAEMFGEKAELVVPKQVLGELESLKKEGQSKAKAVDVAMAEIKGHRVKALEAEGTGADDALAFLAEQGYFVASNDAALRKRIKGFGGKVIYLRQSRFLKKD